LTAICESVCEVCWLRRETIVCELRAADLRLRLEDVSRRRAVATVLSKPREMKVMNESFEFEHRRAYILN
jgi:hypothetical protein